MSIGWVLVWGVVMGISIATGEEACPESFVLYLCSLILGSLCPHVQVPCPPRVMHSLGDFLPPQSLLEVQKTEVG